MLRDTLDTVRKHTYTYIYIRIYSLFLNDYEGKPPLRWVLVYFELLPPAMEYLLLVLPARENPPLRWVLVYFGLLPPAMEYLLLVPPAGAGLL